MAFFILFGGYRWPSREGGKAMEKIERETCKEKEREREREREREICSINFFGFRNKYGMY